MSETATAPRWRLRSPTGATLVGGFLALGVLYGALMPLRDNSFFTHLATGRLILRDGAIPRVDPYTFTARDEPWVVQSWLASVAYAVVERMAGIGGVRVFVALIAVGMVVMIWALTRPATGLVVRLAIAATAVAVGAVAWSPRPLMLGLLLLGATLLVIERRGPLWLLLPIFLFWVNVHGSFPLGLLALATLAVGRRLDHDSAQREVHALAWAAAGTLLGAVNPQGVSLLAFPARALVREDLLRNVVEWQSPDFSGALGRLFLLQAGLAVILIVRSPTWHRAVPLLVFTALALISARNISVASLVLLPGMASAAAGIGRLKGDSRGRVTLAGTVVLAALAVVMAMSLSRAAPYRLDRYPVDAVAWMDQAGLLDPAQRRVVPDFAGNYLELVRGDAANVSSDDRIDMFPAGVVEDYLTIFRGRAGTSAVLERWQPDSILWTRNAPLTSVLLGDDSWRLTYIDDDWVVFVPREG